MRKRSCCLATVVAAVMIFILLCALVLLGDPRYYRIYSTVRLGESEKSVRARYAPLMPKYIGTWARRDDPYMNPSAVKYLLVIDRHGQHYVFYLDTSDRVVQKRHYFD